MKKCPAVCNIEDPHFHAVIEDKIFLVITLVEIQDEGIVGKGDGAKTIINEKLPGALDKRRQEKLEDINLSTTIVWNRSNAGQSKKRTADQQPIPQVRPFTPSTIGWAIPEMNMTDLRDTSNFTIRCRSNQNFQPISRDELMIVSKRVTVLEKELENLKKSILNANHLHNQASKLYTDLSDHSDSVKIYTNHSENIIGIMKSEIKDLKIQKKESNRKFFMLWTTRHEEDNPKERRKALRKSPNDRYDNKIAPHENNTRSSKSKDKKRDRRSDKKLRGWREVMQCLYTPNSAYKPSTASLRSSTSILKQQKEESGGGASKAGMKSKKKVRKKDLSRCQPKVSLI